jgi:DNA-binding CsgD family transcriptional regulator
VRYLAPDNKARCEQQMTRSEDTLELLTSSFDLIRGKIDDEVWLQKLATVMHAESAICARWTCGFPDKTITSCYGGSSFLPAGWANWADHVFNLAEVSNCGHADDIAASLNRPTLAEADPLNSPQVMVGLTDWSPAYICMIVHRDAALGPWSDEDRAYFLNICGLIRKSIEVHKDFSRHQNMASATLDILNSSPRGVLALSTDGLIQFSNAMAEQTLGINDGLSSIKGKLEFSDKNAQQKLTEFIATTKALQLKQLNMMNPEAVISFKAMRPTNNAAYQVMLSSIPLSSWSIETSPSDRMIVLYIHDPHKPMQASAKQFMEYYELTKAQAKLAEHLCSSDNIIGASEALNISINTTRSHLREIYRKTGTNSLPELLKLLTSSLKTYQE